MLGRLTWISVLTDVQEGNVSRGKILASIVISLSFFFPLCPASYGGTNVGPETNEIIVGQNGHCTSDDGFFTYDNMGKETMRP